MGVVIVTIDSMVEVVSEAVAAIPYFYVTIGSLERFFTYMIYLDMVIS